MSKVLPGCKQSEQTAADCRRMFYCSITTYYPACHLLHIQWLSTFYLQNIINIKQAHYSTSTTTTDTESQNPLPLIVVQHPGYIFQGPNFWLFNTQFFGVATHWDAATALVRQWTQHTELPVCEQWATIPFCFWEILHQKSRSSGQQRVDAAVQCQDIIYFSDCWMGGKLSEITRKQQCKWSQRTFCRCWPDI